MPVNACNVCGAPTLGTRCERHPVRRKQQQVRPERGTATYRRVRLLVLERDHRRCYWCGAPATQVDHYPIAYRDGGPSTPDNLVAACARCNKRRGAGPRASWSSSGNAASPPRHLRLVNGGDIKP